MNVDMLRSAIRAARDAGMKWPEVYRIAATEYGAVFRENAIDGWIPVPKPKWPYDARAANAALHPKRKGKR